MLLRILPWLLLLYMGIAFGLSFSLVKFISQAGLNPIAIGFWQSFLSSVFLFTVCKFCEKKIHITYKSLRVYLILATAGNIIPSMCLYISAPNMTAGALSLTLSLVPFFAYGLALLLRLEEFSKVRSLGLLVSFSSICILVVNKGSISGNQSSTWILLASLGTVFIASTNIYISSNKLRKIDPANLSFGMNFLATLLLLPGLLYIDGLPAFSMGALIFLKLITISIIGSTGLIIFIKIARNSGPVFASQVNYLITGFGILWGILLFSESHSIWFWGAFIMMLLGLALVKPKNLSNKD